MSAPIVATTTGSIRPRGGWRMVVGTIVLVVMAASAAYSANVEGVRDRFAPPATRLTTRPAPEPASGTAGAGSEVAAPRDLGSRSQPYWQPLATLSGEGATTTKAFTIDRGALQWRVAWKCTTGTFSLTPVGTNGGARRPLARKVACPAEDTGYSVKSGIYSLRVETAGAWEATVEQQVDVPLIEPPLPEMASPGTTVVATAAMYNVDRIGKGTARIHRLEDGRLVLRLDDFFVSINSDLEIWLSEAEHPTTTPEAAAAPHVQVSFLKATTGAMNYELPEGIDLSRFRSIVIWCELTKNAYAAAILER